MNGRPQQTGSEALVQDTERVEKTRKGKIPRFGFVQRDAVLKTILREHPPQVRLRVAPVESREYILFLPPGLDTADHVGVETVRYEPGNEPDVIQDVRCSNAEVASSL